MKKRVVFFAKVNNADVLERNEFYAVDIQILRELGWDVVISINPASIPYADLYIVWWWTWALFPILRAKLANKPVIVIGVFDHILSDNSLEKFYSRPFFLQFMMRLSLLLADRNVFCSQLELERLRSEFSISNSTYSHCVVNSGIYKPHFTPRESFFLCFCWMSKGNVERKCISELIQAVVNLHEDYPEYKLLICGEKLDGYPILLELVQKLHAQDYVIFPGVVSREHKIDLMQKCAIYLQPSRVEGFGLAIAEALSCGAPVISSPVGTVPEVVGDSACLVDGTNPMSIAEGIRTLLKDNSLRLLLQERARNRIVEHFSYEKRKSELELIIQSVTGC